MSRMRRITSGNKNTGVQQARTPEELWRSCRESGVEEDCNALVQQFTHLVHGVALKYLRSEADRRDMVQEVFANLFAMQSPGVVRDFPAFVFQTARNVAVSAYRRQRKGPVLVEESAFFDKKEDGRVENEGFLRQLGEDDVSKKKALLPEAMKSLSAEQRQCIVLFFHEELSYNEISEQTGLSYKQVKSHLQNGKRMLHKVLSQLMGQGR
ncbi:sigma-70 family RNA polymerase sigma factor [Phaeodactylibacter luteus]|uniref:Sigma-70 family RNA polymerase sigma factor n=2 Tax=Phaeodactylibacter luteus TaxID=1564516 RepID=A0A5C6RMK4_9BACT|nr:sigma-70 family RNA polymerase sigma factor [Phaeodactylibacter luteus]